MDKEIKKEWVEALRSGKYKQGRRTLRDTDDNYCCLGVLCDLSGISQWELGLSNMLDDVERETYYYDGKCGSLSNKIRNWAQIHDSVATSHLIFMNDHGFPFKEIADWIEKNL